MTEAGRLLGAGACCLALLACRGEEAHDPARSKRASTPDPSTAQRSASSPDYTVRHRIHPSLPEFAITVVGTPDAPGETLAVQRIEVRRPPDSPPLQVFTDLEAEPPLQENQVPLEVLDMNFDGYGDFRLVQFRTAGPNVPYLNWLFDPASRNFVRSPALDEIPSARYDAGKRQIASEWRDGPARDGTNVYVYVDGKPVLVRKEERAYRAPGVYTLTRSRLVDGAWETVEEREVRERL